MAPVVARDPDILSGTPVFAGTRVPVQNLIDYLTAGDDLDEFLADFPTVTREQAQAFLEQAKDALLAAAAAERRGDRDRARPLARGRVRGAGLLPRPPRRDRPGHPGGRGVRRGVRAGEPVAGTPMIHPHASVVRRETPRRSPMRTYSVIVERDPETSLFVGYVPGFPGAHSQAETLDELQANMREVIEMLLEDGEPR